MPDIKLLLINGAALAISMTNIEVWLKIILLLVTIGYTLSKWIKLKKKTIVKLNKTKSLDKYNKIYKKDPVAASKYLMW